MAKAATALHTFTLELSSVHDRLADCEQRNGGHLEDVMFRVE